MALSPPLFPLYGTICKTPRVSLIAATLTHLSSSTFSTKDEGSHQSLTSSPSPSFSSPFSSPFALFLFLTTMDEQALQNDPQLQAFLQQQSVQARVMSATMELTEVCWDKCVDKVGSKPISESGDSRTAQCLSNCVGRFIDATSTMLKHMQSKAGE
jgi:import inner membrane translocase subunit TIM8